MTMNVRYLIILIVIHIIAGEETEDIINYDYNKVPPPLSTTGLLYPYESESREVRKLDGVWRFLKSNINNPIEGILKRWFLDDLDKVSPTIAMPVPSSYNDVGVESQLRDHVGTVWYEKKFFVPNSWAVMDYYVWLRFGSVHYAAIVWLNGREIGKHSIGHLPFEMEITNFVKFGAENRLTVMCDNTLINMTIPQGTIMQRTTDGGNITTQTYTFDFFNYAGIHRSVHLYTTPNIFIEDVFVHTDVDVNNIGFVNYEIITGGLNKNRYIEALFVHTQLRNKTGSVVASDTVKKMPLHGLLKVPNPILWWPYLMHTEPGYLYTLEVYLHSADGTLLDVYRLKVGIRSLKWNSKGLYINAKPVYLRGFGRHEDSDIRGKGLDFALLTRDFNLLKWIGANAYRTSHYPYSEESMQFADEHGIMIIDECPSVNTDIFDPNLLRNHKSALEQLIHRDRNHPSVIIWSIANEPRSGKPQADAYFQQLTNYTKGLDKYRPITAAINENIKNDKLAQYLDIVSFNRYNAWYQNAGHLDMIVNSLVKEASEWRERYQKPVLMTEYGADTLEGLHFLPIYIWSEDYQVALLSKHFQGFDILRRQNWFIGELLWNFADFKTEQTTTRVGGNKKGIFTRNRQPKSAAFLLRQRYFALCHELDYCNLPNDLFSYIIDWGKPTDMSRDYTEL